MASGDNFDDLEDELLALAGDGDSVPATPEGEAQSKSHQTPPTAGPTSTQTNSTPQKGVARKMNKRNAASRTQLTLESEEEDAPSSPNSLGSGAMDESDDEDQQPAKTSTKTAAVDVQMSDGEDVVDDGPRYPIEGKFKSQKDREYVLSLPEATREQLLSERVEEMERDNFARQLRQRQAERGSQKTDRKKRSAGDADLDDDSESPRKSTKKSAAAERLQAYKNQRAAKQENRGRVPDKHSRGAYSPEESEDYRPRSASSSASRDKADQVDPTTKLPMDLHHAHQITLPRLSVPQICYNPGFEDVAKGCFLRVAAGGDKHKATQYIAAVVAEVRSAKPYVITTANDNILTADQQFFVRAGKYEKMVPYTQISQSPITASEWETYCETMRREGGKLATRGAVTNKIAALKQLRNYVFTPEELSAKLKRSGARRARDNELEREDAIMRRDQAAAAGDEAALKEAEAEIRQHHANPAFWGARKYAPKNTAEVERMNKLNAEIRKSNSVGQRLPQARQRKPERKTQPPALAATTTNGSEAAASQGSDDAATKPKPGGPVRRKKLQEDDIIAGYDLSVVVDI